MAKVIRLKHMWRTGDWGVYFYEGDLMARDGVLTIPADHPNWVQRAYIQGFRLDPKTNQPFIDLIRVMDSAVEESAESDDASTGGGGQPSGSDGVRSSEPSGDGSVAEGRARGRNRDRAAVRGEAD